MFRSKSRPGDLAACGGTPAFAEPLRLGTPHIGDQGQFFEDVQAIFDRKWLTNQGAAVQQFEQELAEFLGVRHCLTVTNATVGLQVAARAMGMDGEVIVPSFTFAATASALAWQGATPVFCDIDPETHNLDPREVERLITPQTTGILPVHLWGRIGPVEELAVIARRHRLPLLYDAAHAFGCSHNGVRAGNFGDAEVFSFHATKIFHSFEGGGIATNNDALAERMRLLRSFGSADGEYFEFAGINAKMHEVSAAMGLVNLRAFRNFCAINRRNYLLYKKELSGLRGLRIASFASGDDANYQYVPIEVLPEFPLTRDQLYDVLVRENVHPKRYFSPALHLQPAFSRDHRARGHSLPNTERVSNSILVLPTGAGVPEQAVRVIASILRVAGRLGSARPSKALNPVWATGTA